jgi:hypothetical protein
MQINSLKNLKQKYKDIEQKYDNLEKKNKKIILFLIFLIVSIIMSEYLFFKSFDSYRNAVTLQAEQTEEQAKNQNIKKELLISYSEKTNNNLLKQKNDLIREIELLLKNNNSISYVDSKKIPEILGQIVNKIDSLSILNLTNSSIEAMSINSIVYKHFFSIELNGSYQAIYDFILYLQKTNIVHISSLKFDKENSLKTTLVFYILNTNKNMVDF